MCWPGGDGAVWSGPGGIVWLPPGHDVGAAVPTAAVELVAGRAMPGLAGWLGPPATHVALLDDQPAFDEVVAVVAAHLAFRLRAVAALPVGEAAQVALVAHGRRWLRGGGSVSGRPVLVVGFWRGVPQGRAGW